MKTQGEIEAAIGEGISRSLRPPWGARVISPAFCRLSLPPARWIAEKFKGEHLFAFCYPAECRE
jgi:hypothetical protein